MTRKPRLPFLMLALVLPLFLHADELGLDIVKPPEPVPEKGLATCLTCKGAGEIIKKPSGIKWEGSRQRAFSVQCLACDGKGEVFRKFTPEERLTKQRMLLAQFTNDQILRGYAAIGSAFVPAKTLTNLPPHTHSAIAHDYPRYCSKCYGLKFEPCKKCKGEGVKSEAEIKRILKKTDKDDEDDSRYHELTLRRNAISTSAKLNAAYSRNQDDEILFCETCFGKGIQPCSKCDGIGLTPICNRCDGIGLIQKKATKKKPERIDLCKSCKGTGRR